jgi:subtilisin family serine protease
MIDPPASAFATARTTGRHLLLLEEDAATAAARHLKQSAGLTVARTGQAKDGLLAAGEAEAADAVIYDRLGVAVVATAPDQLERLGAGGPAAETGILLMEPERPVFALDVQPPVPCASGAAGRPSGLSAEYLRGYRDAVLHLTERAGHATSPSTASTWSPPLDESKLTWGLVLTGAAMSTYTGAGVRVAVLDTGIDRNHPDFAGRDVVAQSFVDGEEVQDGHGHGTHCVGTACGPRVPGELPRYGVACEAQIYAGKVLSNRGEGKDESLLAGIQWAVANRCPVVSMSLGGPTEPGAPYSRVFEQVGRRARKQGSAIVAAAGDDSRREAGVVRPVSHPANCPSIMAVAALDAQLGVASFSNQGQERGGGQIDFAGPGVDVHSAWPMPTRYRRLSGTSMASPHVAGVVALLAQSEPDASPGELMALLAETALRLSLASTDAGAGLVQAP